MTKKYLWLLPVLPIGLLAAAILLLPSFVASAAHRKNIEDLASSITGRQVRISGKLSLGLFPAPEITAAGVTITGPDQETITARSLALNISLPALLHGQLIATNLALHAPTIAFPWPLPGGASAIAPPSWLAALHAQIQNGDINFGAAHFTGVDADILTGGNGALTISGTGTLAGHALTLTLVFGAPQLTGTTPVTLDAASGDHSLHFTGGLNATSTLSGRLEFATPKIAGTASLTADATALTATTMQLTEGKATVTGTATFDFLRPALTGALTATNLDFSALQSQRPNWPGLPATHLTLTATNFLFRGQMIPALQTTLDADANGVTLHALQASLPGDASLTANAQISPTGAITAKASLDAPDLAASLTGTGLTPPPNWPTAHLSAALSGTPDRLTLSNLTGSIGASHLTGNVILTGRHAAGALTFDHLDLPPLLTWFGQQPAPNFTADGQITAENASFGSLKLTHLLLDASLTDHLNIRRISTNLLDGLAAGSVTLDPSGRIAAARGFLVLPSAKPLAALLSPNWQPPAALVQPRLHVEVFAQGPTTALATSLVATLGDFTLTAAPVINLAQQSATGPLSLRAPNAIAALKIFGLSHAAAPPVCNLPADPPVASLGMDSPCAPPAGQILAWPGAGSLSLRADITAAPTQIGLPDFVLSLGGLTANGRILRTNGVISGQIDSGTLALPPLSPGLNLPWSALAAAQGKITLTTKHVLYNGAEILGSSLGSITLAPNAATLAIARASLAGGNISGSLTATTATNAAPALAATINAANINAAALNLPINFPFTLPTGTLAAQASLTASGYSPRIWAATLAGTASLTAAQGSFNGFSLAGIANALGSPHRERALRTALTSGTTNFQNFTLGATAAHGNASLASASLTSPDGTAGATGSLDMFDNTLALHLTLQPNVVPPLSIGTTILGAWSAPKQFLGLKPALSWPPAD